ncbi:MAG: RagB/SusD family nutrient uptake outer membrane protein [Ginsengibacter sp.]
MKFTTIKNILVSLVIPVLFLLSSCKIEPVPDPNNPSLDHLSTNPTKGEIQNLVTGTESGMRTDMSFYWHDLGALGRDYYHTSSSDPRWTTDLVGKAGAVLDNNTFYTTRPYNAAYLVVKNANILLSGLTNTKTSITDQERKVGIAYANTVKAYELLLVWNLQYDNGIRVDVANPDALGPFLSRADALKRIIGLMDSAYTDLNANAATAFPFKTTLYGNTAGEFAKFNRALAARMEVYNSEWSSALTDLENSFFDLNGDLYKGAYYNYSTAGGDLLNPLYIPANSSGEVNIAQTSFVTDAESPADKRLNKVSKRTTPYKTDDITGIYDLFLYKSNIDPLPIIRNEELLLIYAEAKIQLGGISNFMDATIALNKIRVASGLLPYSGPITQSALITEMLKQRRYSLYGEGHRWIDMRRYNLLNTLPNDRPGDHVWPQFPRPAGEPQ